MAALALRIHRISVRTVNTVDGDLRPPSDHIGNKNAPGGRVPPQSDCM